MSKYRRAPFRSPEKPLPPNLVPKTDGKLALVTADLIFAIRSKAGAWNQYQIEAIGVEWPPKQGWLAKFKNGIQIPLEQWEIAVANSNRINP